MKTTSSSKFKKYVASHKVLSSFIVIVVLVGAYITYKKVTAAPAVPQYTLSPARIGNITENVTGSGQVSSENQLDVTSEVSGKVVSINVSVGEHVKAGDLLATLDSHDAYVSLQNARISYAKLVKPAEIGDLTNAENNISKSYDDAYSSISDAFVHIPTILNGLNEIFYTKEGYLSDQQVGNLSSSAQAYRATAVASYDVVANAEYAKILNQYKSLSKTSPQSDLDTMITATYNYMRKVSDALKNTQTAVTFISSSQQFYNSDTRTSTTNNLSTWLGQANGDVSSLLGVKNSIASNLDSLDTLNKGADALDIESQKLSLDQAERTYAKYFVRAPFEGVVGKIPVFVYGQAGGSTVIATIIGDQKNAVISLNEVDAAKVSAGQKVGITFDAVDGLNATGTVRSVDQVGTVSQGVVSYSVKIGIDTEDPRVKPGMSVNTSIITKEKNDVLVVPTSAIKTQGNRKYVQVLSTRMGSTTPRTGFTISSATPPAQVTVEVGDSDDTNTEIMSGLNPGQFVVTKTALASGATGAAAPNILSSIGNRGNAARGGTGTVRATTITR